MSIVSRLRKTYTYLRWTLKPPRYLGKLVRTGLRGRRRTAIAGASLTPGGNVTYDGLCAEGYAKVPGAAFELPEIDLVPLRGKAHGMPFFNCLPGNWARLKPLICVLLTEPHIADCLLRYFDGRPWLWNAALNYSEPSNSIQESQLWHFDYGDRKQLHLMLYFSEVDADCGPFTFFPAGVSDRIVRSPLEIERFSDADLKARFGVDAAGAIRLTGRRGDCFVNDPGRTLHQGARCAKPRLVLFLTFTTTAPMSRGGSKTLRAEQRRDLCEYYQRVAGGTVFREEFFT